MLKFFFLIIVCLFPVTSARAVSFEKFGKLKVAVSKDIEPKSWRLACGMYTANILDLLFNDAGGTVSVLPPTAEAAVASLASVSGLVGETFAQDIIKKFSGVHTPVGTTIDAMTSVQAKHLLLCYVSGKCTLPDKGSYFPLIYKLKKNEVAPLFDFNTSMYVPENGRIRADRFAPQLLMISRSPADVNAGAHSKVIDFFGELAKFSAWVDLYEVSYEIQDVKDANSFFGPYLTKEGKKLEWDAGFLFVYSHLKSFIVRHALMAEHLDTLGSNEKLFEKYRTTLTDELRALFTTYGPMLEKVLPHFNVSFADGAEPNLLAGAMRAEREVDAVLLRHPDEGFDLATSVPSSGN